MVVVPRNIRSKEKVHPNAQTLAAVLQAIQAQGKSVVLANGVFDLLHVGHIRCLEDARARGDYLVVAVNDDKSAERNKGKGHPVIPCDERMEMISALWFVDYVTCFAEDTVDELLRMIRPQSYAKGTDYNAKTLPEKDTLKELGIKPVFVGDSKGHSTSKIIQRIRRKKFG
ncbi:MAG: adenylyltransferase/cytidyltransferase family protein [Planctomycetota bacterium]